MVMLAAGSRSRRRACWRSRAAQGHFIEALDKTYNAADRLARKTLVPPNNGCNPAYDAVRIIDGKFAGGVQQKSSANGINKAIAQMERAKAGSARSGTARVPGGNQLHSFLQAKKTTPERNCGSRVSRFESPVSSSPRASRACARASRRDCRLEPGTLNPSQENGNKETASEIAPLRQLGDLTRTRSP
jgi:hypothetical protein